MAFTFGTVSAPRMIGLSRFKAGLCTCRRFAGALADACARLGADVDRYSFTVRDLHPLLLAGLPAHSDPFAPAHYEPSSLVRIGPPQCSASVLLPRNFLRLCFSLCIGATGSCSSATAPASDSRPFNPGRRPDHGLRDAPSRPVDGRARDAPVEPARKGEDRGSPQAHQYRRQGRLSEYQHISTRRAVGVAKDRAAIPRS